MTGPYITRRDRVLIDPTIPGDGGAPLDAEIAIPPEFGVQINGAPVTEQSHEYVLKKKPTTNA